MAKVQGYAVFLHRPSLPTEFVELFDRYWGKKIAGQTYFLSAEFEQIGAFARLALFRQDGGKDATDWHVQIPISFILAITEVHDPAKVGFV
jgi:hypothetical protein